MSDKPDFERLVEEHGREIYVYLWRILQDTADAEDCLQDTYLRAYRAFPRLDGEANFRAWLYKIATNAARTHLKQRTKRGERTAQVDLQSLSDGGAGREAMDQRLSLIMVREAVEGLPHKQRAALLMRKYQGLAYAEIAEALNTSASGARANVYQGLKKLRAKMADGK